MTKDESPASGSILEISYGGDHDLIYLDVSGKSDNFKGRATSMVASKKFELFLDELGELATHLEGNCIFVGGESIYPDEQDKRRNCHTIKVAVCPWQKGTDLKFRIELKKYMNVNLSQEVICGTELVFVFSTSDVSQFVHNLKSTQKASIYQYKW